MDEIYAQLLLDAAKHPANYGELPTATLRGEQVNASCGDHLQVALEVDDSAVITQVRWQGEGCVISRAHMSSLSEMLIGKQLSEVMKLTKQDMLALLGFDEGLAPGREKCLMIGLVTVQKMIAKQLES